MKCTCSRVVYIVIKLCTLRLPAFGRDIYGGSTGYRNSAWHNSELASGVSHGNTLYHVFCIARCIISKICFHLLSNTSVAYHGIFDAISLFSARVKCWSACSASSSYSCKTSLCRTAAAWLFESSVSSKVPATNFSQSWVFSVTLRMATWVLKHTPSLLSV